MREAILNILKQQEGDILYISLLKHFPDKCSAIVAFIALEKEGIVSRYNVGCKVYVRYNRT